MRIKSLKIKNVKSFGEEVNINFNDFNILIGPNAGGKSNLLDILTVVIRHFFVKPWIIRESRQGNRWIKSIVSQQIFNPLERFLDKFFGKENEESLIEIVFHITKEDTENISQVISRLDEMKNNLGKYNNGTSFIRFFDQFQSEYSQIKDLFKEGEEVVYKIKNNSLESSHNNLERFYLQYLNSFELFIILGEDDVNLFPVYIYFSPYRAFQSTSLQANLSSQSFWNLYLQYVQNTSRNLSSTIELSSYYFAEKVRKMETDREKGWETIWNNDSQVKEINEYFRLLGYSLDINCIDPKRNIYEILLSKNGNTFYLSQASSGEKEIINFILGIFSLNIKGGLIIIDEPELHLHPKWQKLLLIILKKLQENFGNQFILSTHSPTLIDETTIKNVIRVFRNFRKNFSSDIVKVEEESIPELRDLLHIIKTHNNERIFFADKVILVEGISDRIIFENLLKYWKPEKSSEVVEVVEVHGKNNFDKYTRLLKAINCDYLIVADLDYVVDISRKSNKKEILIMFEIDFSKIDEDVIKNKKSKDGKVLADCIEKAVKEDKITDELKMLWDYIKTRFRRLKESLSQSEIEKLKEYVSELREEGIYILCHGEKLNYKELEDFLPETFKTLDKIIEFINKKDFNKWVREVVEKYEVFKTIKEVLSNDT